MADPEAEFRLLGTAGRLRPARAKRNRLMAATLDIEKRWSSTLREMDRVARDGRTRA